MFLKSCWPLPKYSLKLCCKNLFVVVSDSGLPENRRWQQLLSCFLANSEGVVWSSVHVIYYSKSICRLYVMFGSDQRKLNIICVMASNVFQATAMTWEAVCRPINRALAVVQWPPLLFGETLPRVSLSSVWRSVFRLHSSSACTWSSHTHKQTHTYFT